MSQSSNQTDEFPSPICSMIGEKLYLNERLADFHFIFETNDGEYERVPAHKNFLIAASDVFEAMFNGSWEEMDEVGIVDSPVAAFGEFLQFFYLGRVKITAANVSKVMYLANKYNLADGLNVCVKFIESTLSADNVCWGYGLAILFGQESLKNLCKIVISINTKDVFASKNFLECDRDVLEHILNLDSMNCSEPELFEACISWVKSSSNQNELTREIVHAELGGLMNKIRFGSISSKEIASLIPSHGDLFSIDEYKDIVQMMGSDEYQPKVFTEVRRKRAETTNPNNSPTIECNRLISKYCSIKIYNIKDVETTVFSCNRPLLLTAFMCDNLFESISKNVIRIKENVPTKVEVIEQCGPSRSEVVLHNEETVLLHNEPTQIT
ncbi:BTB/POZ domain-containing protein 3-like [Sitodiplosis mosellana]|uniref:BTB/POZ domain-containing protein 3-like n=1 Tax=Sitodiplosis mosellana TaxID=263140 RepID=UPI00244505A1|nr:BTB/POZ domain-containing protein 3-like [Sitodiplosis mosellana]